MVRYNSKLSEQQKEYIGILGRFVSSTSLAKEFGVSTSTIVNFKRKTGGEYIDNYKKRLLNATKTYQTSPDPYIKDKMAELVFLPIARKVARDMGQEIILRPIDGHLMLYQRIFYEGIETKEKLKENTIAIIADELIKYVSTSKVTNAYRLIVDLKSTLIEKLSLEQYKPLPPDLKERFDNVLFTLNGREAEVLRLRFGLDDGYLHSLRKVGSIFNISPERTRQIESNALRKLRHPTRSREIKELGAAYLRYLNHLKAPEEEHQKKKGLEDELELWASQIDKFVSSADLGERLKGLINTHRKQLENYYLPSCIEKSLNYSLLIGLFEYVNLLETKIDAFRRGEAAKVEVEEKKPELVELEKKLAMPVSNFEFSVRSYYCLKEASIKTVRDLVQKTEEEMLTYRNFGKKSLNEVNEALAKMGLSLGMYV